MEMTFLLIFLLNVVYHLTTYFVLFFTLRPVPLSDKQKQLMGVKKTGKITSPPQMGARSSFD